MKKKNMVFAKINSFNVRKPIKNRPVNFDTQIIKNMSIAYHLDSLNETDEELLKIKNLIDEYNEYEKFIFSLPNFLKILEENSMVISYETSLENWGYENTKRIFQDLDYPFCTQFKIYNNNLIITSENIKYNIETETGVLPIRLTENDVYYEKNVLGLNIKILVNVLENKQDFAAWMYTILLDLGCISLDEKYDQYDAYEQWRFENYEPNVNLMKCFSLLHNMGYIREYCVKPYEDNLYWDMYAKADGTIDIAILDMRFKKSKLAMERLKLIVNAGENEIINKPYILTDGDNHQYLSSEKGDFGGHHKLHIYGRLDCKSANSYIQKGEYVQNRVFFLCEDDAKKAGYRPCCKCMKEEYLIWKNEVKSNDLEK